MTAPRASGDEFPYGWPGRVCYIEHEPGGLLQQCRVQEELRAAVKRALDGVSTLYAVWPGEWRSDLFLVDPQQLAEKIGV